MGAIQSKIKNNKLNKSFNNEKEMLLAQERRKNIIKHFSTQEVSISPAVKFPSTDSDIDYLHEHHFFIKSIWSTNYSSPTINELLIKGGIRVLDAVCAAGTFLLELSNEYQTSEFYGVDKTNLFPKEIKPNNLNFVYAELLEGLPFEENYFDFVHLNITEPIYYLHQWDQIFKELLRVTKPGGYVEIQGFDYTVENFGPKFLRFIEEFAVLFETCHTEMKPRDHLRILFNMHDFETSNYEHKIVPIGKFGGNLGMIFEQHCTMFFIDGVGEMLSKSMNIDRSEYERQWNEVLVELSDGRKTTCECYRLWGRKKMTLAR